MDTFNVVIRIVQNLQTVLLGCSLCVVRKLCWIDAGGAFANGPSKLPKYEPELDVRISCIDILMKRKLDSEP